MPRYDNGEIILSGEETERFLWLAKHPDPAVARRRDAFFDEIDRTIRITKVDGGFMVESLE